MGRDAAKAGAPVKSAAAQRAFIDSQMGGKCDRCELPQLELLNVLVVVKAQMCNF